MVKLMQKKHLLTPEAEINRRIRGIQKEMGKSNIDGLLVTHRVDLFYFSGTAQNGFLYIPLSGDPLLLIKRYYPRAKTESPLKNVLEVISIKEVPDLISDHYGERPKVLAFALDVMPVRTFNYYHQLFNAREYVDASTHIFNVRMIKSPWEIEQIEKAAELSRKTFEYMRTAIRAGLSEIEFAGMFETFARKHGHGGQMRVRDRQTEGYPWHVLSGKSGGMVGLLDSPASGEGTSPAFPCGAGSKKMTGNEPIMIDLGTVLNGYHMDETRMFAIDAMPPQAMQACEAAIEIQRTVFESVKPGIRMNDLFQLSSEIAGRLGYAVPFLGPPGYEVSFVGHGIGLELIEPPYIARGKKERLESGMVFALEPKLVFENKFSAGIESVFLVTDDSARWISRTPMEAFVC